MYECNENILTNIYSAIEFAQNQSKHIETNFNINTISTSKNSETCNWAIYIHGPKNFDGVNSFIHVEDNPITEVLNGIEVANFSLIANVTINYNPIISIHNLCSCYPQYGIYVLNTRLVEIKDNHNIGGNAMNNNITGIHLNKSEYCAVNCNHIHDVGTGVSFGGSCITGNPTNGLVHNNEFSNYRYAILAQIYSSVSIQGSSSHPTDNEWTNSGGSVWDLFNSSSTPITFYYRSDIPVHVPNLYYPAGGFNIIPTSYLNNSGVSCAPSRNSSTLTASNILSTDELIMMRKLAEGDIDFPVLESETKWTLGEMIYSKLKMDTTINPNDTVIVGLMDSLANCNIGKFYNVETAILNEDWQQAASFNQAISYQNHIEENLKKYNTFFLAYRIDSTLSTDSSWIANMINELSPIASECYKIGGPAVISSRTMLSYFSNEIFQENTDCFKLPEANIISDSSNTSCDLIKKYSVPLTNGASYSWTVPSGTTYTQTINSIAVNWGSKLLSGGTITCTIMDSLGNSSFASFKQDTLITSPTCVSVAANNTNCVSATNLSWNAPAGCAAGYYLMLGTNGGGTSVPNNLLDSLDVGNVTTYTLAFLNSGTTYYYKVIPYNNSHTPISGCAIGSFTSGGSVTYTPTLSTPYLQNFDGVAVPALPCGITTSDENYPIDGVSWKTSNFESCSGTNSLSIERNPNNTNAKDDWFYSNPLNLSAGELYRVEFKEKVQAGQSEGLETYFSNGRDAATMLSTSAILTNTIPNTTCSTLVSADYVANTSGIYAVGIHANSGANKGTIYIDDLKVSLIKTTHLTTSSCGDSLNSCDTLHCVAYTGATSYKFKFEDLANSFSQEYTVSNANPRVYQFFGTNPLALGHSYSVSVSATTGGGVWSPYGAVCDIYINPVPIRGLTGASCGGTLSDLSQLIYANTSGICQIADFKYQFTDLSNNTVIETQRNSATTSFLMTYITTPYVKYSTTYSVKVKLKIGNTWGEYGSACNVTTPASPLTKLTSTYCNYTLPTFATPVNCVSILGAQDYRYKITGPGGYNRTFNRNSSATNWYFTWTNSSPYMQANTTYYVKVASSAGGVWSAYGDSCSITTPATLSRLADTSFFNTAQVKLEIPVEENINTLSMNVYPNPNNFEQEFSIEINGIKESNQKIELYIFNLIGEKIYQSEIYTKDEKRILIKNEINLNQGIYLIESILNNEKLRKKFVVE